MNKRETENFISKVPTAAWQAELEKTSSKYHVIAVWAAIIFDPLFSATDYFNIPGSWRSLLLIRLTVALITFIVFMISKKKNWPSYIMVSVPFLLISLQNAYTYSLINNAHLLGHNLNYMALLIGAALFLLWKFSFSIVMIVISAAATAFFVYRNEQLTVENFLVDGGFLLFTIALFMMALIKTRYDLTVKQIKTRLALEMSNSELQERENEIKQMNEGLEILVMERTKELEKKNAALEEYAFINAHKLRSPVASILGLTNLMKKIKISEEAQVVMNHIHSSTEMLDSIISSITRAIQKGDK